MPEFLIVWLVVAIGLVVISKLGLGTEVDDFGSALFGAGAIGIVNALIKPILTFFSFPFILLTLGLFLLVVNAICLMIAAALVPGFRVKGFGGALIGSIALTIFNLVVMKLVGVKLW
jgi:putative membrane protein